MELLELVVQGLQGARDLVRVPFAPGLTVMPAEQRERLYVRVLLDVLYPKGTEPTLTDVDEPRLQSRVGVTVQGRDNQRYRLLLDVKSGRRALQKIVGDKAEVITSTSNEIAQAVTATIGFPTEDVLRELMFATREDLPSKRKPSLAGAPSGSGGNARGDGEVRKPKAEKPLPPGFEQTSSGVGGGASKPLPPGFSDFGAPAGGGGASASRGGRTDEQIKARIKELDDILRTQGSVKELEFEMDGLQKRLFELEAKMKPLTTMRRSVQQAEEQLRRFAHLDAVPSDLGEKGQRLEKIRTEHERDLRRMEDERNKLLDSAQHLDRRGRQNPIEVAQKDPLVLYGVAAGVVAILLAVVGALVDIPAMRWLAFIDIPAFGVAIFGGLRVLASLEQGESIRRRIERLDVERKRLDERFRIDEEQMLGVLNRHGFTLEQLPDLEQQLKVRDDARAVLSSTKSALMEAERGGDVVGYEREQAETQARLRALEERLSSANAGFSSTADIQHEREELQALLAGGTHESAGAGMGMATSAPLAEVTGDDMVINTAERMAYGGAQAGGAPAAEQQRHDDLGKRLLQLASDVLMAPVEDVGAQVKARATQILGALSDGRLKDVLFGGRGETTVVDAADDTIAFGALPAFDRDLTWLAIKIALIELVVKRGRLPVIFDRSLDHLVDAKGPMLQKMLTFLAQQTQVISLSEKPALGGRPS